MTTYNDVQNSQRNGEMVKRINEIAYYIGIESNENNAVINAGFFNLLTNLKCHFKGEEIELDGIKEEIADLAFYLGSEMNAGNADFVSQSIGTLYEIKEAIAA